MSAERSGGLAVVEVVHGQLVLESCGHLELSDIEALALAGLVGIAQRCEDVCKSAQTGEVVGGDFAAGQRLSVLEALKCHVAGERLADGVIAAAADVVGIAALAVAGEVSDDELGVPGPEDLIGQAPLGVGAALGGLDEDIGVGEKLLQDLASLGRGDVERDVSHVLAVALGAHAAFAAVGVGGLGAFDPDNVSAHFRHKGGGNRSGDDGRCIDDGHAAKHTKFRNISSFCHLYIPLFL